MYGGLLPGERDGSPQKTVRIRSEFGQTDNACVFVSRYFLLCWRLSFAILPLFISYKRNRRLRGWPKEDEQVSVDKTATSGSSLYCAAKATVIVVGPRQRISQRRRKN